MLGLDIRVMVPEKTVLVRWNCCISAWL